MSMETVTFHEIYSRYSRDVYRFAHWLSGSPAEADDIMAETFVRLWTSDSEIRFESVKAYLLAIARNIYLKGTRTDRRRAELDDRLPDPHHSPLARVETRSELGAVLRAMRQLSEIDRALLLLVAEEELSYDEIARATGLTVGAAKVRVFRARMKLQSILQDGVVQ